MVLLAFKGHASLCPVTYGLCRSNTLNSNKYDHNRVGELTTLFLYPIYTQTKNDRTILAPALADVHANMLYAPGNDYDEGRGFDPDLYMPYDVGYAKYYAGEDLPPICDVCLCAIMTEVECTGIILTEAQIVAALGGAETFPEHTLLLQMEDMGLEQLTVDGIGKTLHEHIGSISYYLNKITEVEAGTFKKATGLMFVCFCGTNYKGDSPAQEVSWFSAGVLEGMVNVRAMNVYTVHPTEQRWDPDWSFTGVNGTLGVRIPQLHWWLQGINNVKTMEDMGCCSNFPQMKAFDDYSGNTFAGNGLPVEVFGSNRMLYVVSPVPSFV